MISGYEELDVRRTPLGELILRRRVVPGLGDAPIFEVKLDGELLMSSLLTESERALATLALPAVRGEAVDVLVGGLGLGFTAKAALDRERVRSVTVVELLPEVIEWHERGLVPLGPVLVGDARCRVVQGDFFQVLEEPGDAYGAILVDIDHAPDSWLHPDHAEFYGEAGLGRAKGRLRDGGVFGFWSSGRPRDAFAAGLASCFGAVETHEITVFNPLVGEDQTDTIYVAST